MGDERILQVACGGFHALALTETGKVISWGHGEEGQLGHSGTRKGKWSSPKEVSFGGDARVVHVAAGPKGSLAACEDGRVFAWGRNAEGQLGIDSQSPKRAIFEPVVAACSGSAAFVALGAEHGMAALRC